MTKKKPMNDISSIASTMQTSSGIGHDSSETSSNYSPCVSTSSLDADAGEGDEDDDDDDDDDAEFHSSATSPDAVLAGREIRRAASLQV
jgi:hypothetical protein